MYNFHSQMMIIQENLSGDLMENKIWLALGFEPTTFRLVSSCLGITFLTGICISPTVTLPILVASTL